MRDASSVRSSPWELSQLRAGTHAYSAPGYDGLDHRSTIADARSGADVVEEFNELDTNGIATVSRRDRVHAGTSVDGAVS